MNPAGGLMDQQTEGPGGGSAQREVEEGMWWNVGLWLERLRGRRAGLRAEQVSLGKVAEPRQGGTTERGGLLPSE